MEDGRLFYLWLCLLLLDASIGCVSQSFLSECVFFFNHSLSFSLWILYLSLPVGDKVFQSDDKWNC